MGGALPCSYAGTAGDGPRSRIDGTREGAVSVSSSYVPARGRGRPSRLRPEQEVGIHVDGRVAPQDADEQPVRRHAAFAIVEHPAAHEPGAPDVSVDQRTGRT